MKIFFERFRRFVKSGDFTFIVVVVMAYASALNYMRRPLSQKDAAVLVFSCVLFLLLGICGFAYCKRRNSPAITAAYFAFQLFLAATIVALARDGLILLIMMPLIGQSVVLLPRRWMVSFSLLILFIMDAPVAARGGMRAAVTAGLVYLAAITFVAVFTHTAIKEQNARIEIEHLAEELSEANLRLREYAAQSEELAAAKERNRLAREIHDCLGHYLTIINIQLEAAKMLIDSDPERAVEAVNNAKAKSREGLTEIRRSIAALRNSPIDGRQLTDAVADLLEECRTSGIQADLRLCGNPRPLSSQVELTLYRAAQEGLTNVRKHARAANAEIALDFSSNQVVKLIVKDDGVGASDPQGGFGLMSMRERVKLLGGEFRVRTELGEGFMLELELAG